MAFQPFTNGIRLAFNKSAAAIASKRETQADVRTRMKKTYKAVEVSAPGVLRVVEPQVSEPGADQVRIRVEACGICHTDASTVTGTYPGLTLPRVPGHEVVGRIAALGSGVSRWKIGQRVGVGFFGGEDGVCEPCRRGDIVNCHNPVVPGVTVDGGYAEAMIAEARGISSIPDDLGSAEANSALPAPRSLPSSPSLCAFQSP
jgi:D-arabinose 1-dehydrogenase-like Zn-dependent alcohol dehydrogenase